MLKNNKQKTQFLLTQQHWSLQQPWVQQRRQQAAQIEKLMGELREIKQVLKVPRMHFKYLEQLQFD